jgi:hypothetical protein
VGEVALGAGVLRVPQFPKKILISVVVPHSLIVL